MRRIALLDTVERTRSRGNRLADTMKLKLGLERLGHYRRRKDDPFLPGADDAMFAGIESFQSDQGLKVDGVVKPGGPTEAALNAALVDAPPPPPTLPPWIIPINPVPGEIARANKRTAGALSRTSDVGDLPAFVVSALKGGSDTAPAEIVDLFAQAHDRAPKQAGRLRAALDDYLNPADTALLDRHLGARLGGAWSETVARASRARDEDERALEAARAVPPKGTLGYLEERPGSGKGDFVSPERGADTYRDSGLWPPDAPHPHGRVLTLADDQQAQAPDDAAGKDARAAADDLFRKYRDNLRPREGGHSENPEDSGRPTDKGISTKFLDLYNKKYPEKGLPSDPSKLTNEQRDRLYQEEFFDRPQIDKLADVPGLEKAAPDLAEQMFDSGVLHGPETAGKWLQQALDEKLGTDLKTEAKDGSKSYDGIVGSQTRAAVERAIKEGKIKDVNNTVVEKRLELMRKQPEYLEFKDGWERRAKSFLM